ncbi:MAG TPA: hypothetical protein VFB79_07785, partial [Candidatus Angelobacter sp.]|nr:hypothetical protein [Candidatus Angelobacter sp.]
MITPQIPPLASMFVSVVSMIAGNPAFTHAGNFFSMTGGLAFMIGGEVFTLIRQTGAVAQVVLVILLIFSIMSWSVILTKWSALKRARAQSGRFLRAFRKAQRLQDIDAISEQFKPSPLVTVFDNAYDEFRRQGEGNITAVQRAAQIASSEELTRLER